MHFYCVIGANYGDEGKGLVTDHLANKIVNEDKESCIVLLNNGGAQRGHTVIRDGKRHVFHHFGSGTMLGVPTFITCNFITNPMIFMNEYHELESLDIKPSVYISNFSRITTPFDMIINQITSTFLGKHDTCGVGIWETIRRGDTHDIGWYTKNLDICYKDYMEKRYDTLIDDIIASLKAKNCKDLSGLEDMFKSYMKNIDKDGLIEHFKSDLIEMNKIRNNHFVNFTSDHDFALQCRGMFENVIIENGQGLLLDWHYDPEFGTPSLTGAAGPYRYLNSIYNIKEYDTVNLCYVTRSYLTRHGDGDFPEEVVEEYYNDSTNVTNPNQGKIRFGRLNYNELIDRANKDSANCKYPHYKYLYITHRQKYQYNSDLTKNFKKVYLLPFND